MTSRLPLTCDDTVGPYYPSSFMDANRVSLARNEHVIMQPIGDPIELTIRVFDEDGRPVAPVLLEVWQADSLGGFSAAGDAQCDPWFEGNWRYLSRDGVLRLQTIKPGAVERAGATRAPHINLTIFCDGLSKVVTQIFFEDERLNEVDPLLLSVPEELRSRLLARKSDKPDIRAYTFDVILRGVGETPFFDDRW